LLSLCCSCAGAGDQPDLEAPDSTASTQTATDSVADVIPEPADSSGADRNAQWTAGMTKSERNVTGAAMLRAIRTARHSDYDRIVFDFGPDPVPDYTIEYVDRPVRDCGAGNVIPLAGDAWLAIRIEPANAHTEEGRPTLPGRAFTPGLPVLLELKQICDFEAQVQWVAGLAAPNPYRAATLTAPNRLIVDVRHARD
jgi:hypothetical protein